MLSSPPQPAIVAIPALQSVYGETPLAIATNDGLKVSGWRVVVCTLTDSCYCAFCPASSGKLEICSQQKNRMNERPKRQER